VPDKPTIDKPASEKPPAEKPAGKPVPERTPGDKSPEKPAEDPPSAPAATTKPAPAPAPPSSTRDGDYSLARQLGLRVARIVIDPGHGGHDPGAMANGVTEAELVLDVALKLEKLLQQVPGVEVVLTRRTNEFIPLEERTAIANRERADLFLSIHANSHRQAAVRGIETYFLNFATNPEAEAVAARENATSSQTMGTLPAIVRAIALNNKIAESRELASIVQTVMVRKLRVQSAGVRDLGVKQAPFVVLIGAQMPSVLTEIAFLTNRTEASLLKQQAYRQQIAQALRDGIVRYRESLKKVITVASSK
jgi:N-acetylmuramoyl-L-alanine amidase